MADDIGDIVCHGGSLNVRFDPGVTFSRNTVRLSASGSVGIYNSAKYPGITSGTVRIEAALTAVCPQPYGPGYAKVTIDWNDGCTSVIRQSAFRGEAQSYSLEGGGVTSGPFAEGTARASGRTTTNLLEVGAACAVGGLTSYDATIDELTVGRHLGALSQQRPARFVAGTQGRPQEWGRSGCFARRARTARRRRSRPWPTTRRTPTVRGSQNSGSPRRFEREILAGFEIDVLEIRDPSPILGESEEARQGWRLALLQTTLPKHTAAYNLRTVMTFHQKAEEARVFADRLPETAAEQYVNDASNEDLAATSRRTGCGRCGCAATTLSASGARCCGSSNGIDVRAPGGPCLSRQRSRSR